MSGDLSKRPKGKKVARKMLRPARGEAFAAIFINFLTMEYDYGLGHQRGDEGKEGTPYGSGVFCGLFDVLMMSAFEFDWP